MVIMVIVVMTIPESKDRVQMVNGHGDVDGDNGYIGGGGDDGDDGDDYT